jgi:hypothetical protein
MSRPTSSSGGNLSSYLGWTLAALLVGTVSWPLSWLLLGSYLYPATHPDYWSAAVVWTALAVSCAVSCAAFLLIGLRFRRHGGGAS